jgi:sigma-B regulation protein RsbU (phosphoserine phosphatase)
LIGEVAFAGLSELISSVDEDRGSSAGTIMATAMKIDEQIVGVICAVDRRVPTGPFVRDDLFLLESLSGQVALGGTLIEVYERLSEQHRLQQELQLAREIQNSLLPTAAPSSDWFQVHGVNRTASEVSGDFYDFVELSEDFLLVLVADASGKGVPACMIMAMCRSFVRANAIRYRDNLEGLLKALNQSLFSDTDGAKFVTAACCLIDKRDGTVEYARAGHTELLIHQPGGRIEVISPDGPALGLLPDDEVTFDTFSFSWLPDTSILLFTDGITEALNADEDEFGLTRLTEALHRCDTLVPEETAERILDEVAAFTEEQPQTDDQTMVILSRTA